MSSEVTEASTSNMAVRVENLSKVFPGGIVALDDVSIEVYPGEFVVVIGLSGSGKSTLLRCINRLEDPTAGRIWISGREITDSEGADLRALRTRIGMIFQQFNLIRRHSVLINVLSGSLGRAPLINSLFVRFTEEERVRAQTSLERVGLGDRGASRADTLSGGQQQRVAIARALMQRPELILADEPVASLDPALRHSVMRQIESLNQQEGMTVLCTLHDIDLIERYASRVIALRDGQVVYEGKPERFDAATFRQIYGEDAEPSSHLDR